MPFFRLRVPVFLAVLAISTLAHSQASAKAPAKGSNPPSPIPQTTIAINSTIPLSQRVVAYAIDAKYDPKTHALDASEVLTYHNLSGQPQDHFPFHLYLNAFQPKATWIREAKAMGTRDVAYDKWEDKEFGSEEIQSFEVVGIGDLTSKLEFIQPDDNNKDDKTVVQVVLPKAVAPNDFVQFKIRFHDKFPETQARTGWKRDFVLGGQWFPKVGVWWHGAWNCHQFHATTEFFADFGVYDVNLTLPQDEIVGASGVRVKEVKNSDGTQTLSYHGDDIHDFAWTASPRYRVADDTFQGSMGPVQLHIMMQPAHWSQEERHARILKDTLEHFERWYGPYPYKTLTLVDPEPDSAAGGMEYPTFITGDTNWWMPAGIKLPEIVVEHEFGHQYWYGMVATNEFEEAWLDEGINSYTEVKVLDSILGRDTSGIAFFGMTAGEREIQRLQYIYFADLDPMSRYAYKFANFNSYGGVTYGKTASVLLTLEKLIGEETLQKALHTYFMRYRFTHPTGEDFLKTIEEVSGKDLSWYFKQAVYGTPVFDYEVMKLTSVPANWYEKDVKEKKGETVYNSTVMIHRKGDFLFPVDVEVTFDNHEKVREQWDGQDRWIKFQYNKRARITSVEIDPDHQIHLDRDNFNNSKTAEPHSRPAHKLENYWIFVSQCFSQILAWWAI